MNTLVKNFPAPTDPNDDSLIDWAAAFTAVADWCKANPEIILCAITFDTNAAEAESVWRRGTLFQALNLALAGKLNIPAPRGVISIFYVEG